MRGRRDHHPQAKPSRRYAFQLRERLLDTAEPQGNVLVAWGLWKHGRAQCRPKYLCTERDQGRKTGTGSHFAVMIRW